MGSVNSSEFSSVRGGSGRISRRRRILAAARAEFSRRGFRRSTLDQVVRRAHVGKATVYREFGSKDRLLLAVATAGIEELRDRMVEAVSSSGEPEEVFGRAIRSALEFFDENRDLARVLLLEARELHQELVRRYFGLYRDSRPVAASAFVEQRVAVPLRGHDYVELADVLMYLVAGRVLVWLMEGQATRLQDDADLLLHAYVSGVFDGCEERR